MPFSTSLTATHLIRRRGQKYLMKNILIVEDEDRIAAFLEKGLQKNGFTTAIATDGYQAALMARSSNFDLLLLDLGLPGKDGWALLKELRNQGKQFPIIIVTARSDERDKAAGLEAGANDYVTKPFRFEELLARVRLQLHNG